MPPGSKVTDFEARLYRAKRNRACDLCRKRKARCDGYEILDNFCTNCVTHGVECTYFESSKRPTSKTYVRELENRLAQVERLIRELSDPNSRVSQSVRESQQAKEKQRALVDPAPSLGQAHPSLPFARIPQVDTTGALPETNERDNEDFVVLYDNREGGIYFDGGGSPKLFGESSVYAFSRIFGKDFPTRRPKFWITPACLLPILNGPRTYFEFPEPSLIRHLLDIYFDIHNIILPVLHRPSFERSFADRLHERSESFGTVVILTCAIACRYSDDPRVKHSVATSTSNTGWNLFNQIDRLRRTRLVGHQLYDVQIYALAACFLDGFAPPHIPWTIAGIGLRVMQDIGVHRRGFSAKKSLENELWKRSFWVLVVVDRSFSNLLGRPCAIQDEDFDVDLPLSCDDEYLEYPDPEKAFKQPDCIPSQMDYFISMIRLIQILAFAQRALYSTRKSRTVLGYVGKQWESHILSSLGTAMKKWADSVPPHLRWDAQKDQINMTWLRQALALACNYHELQLIVHRQFIDRPDPTLSGPALAVCNEAARNCVDALNSVKNKVNGKIRCHAYVKPLFLCMIFLVLQFYRKRSIDRESEVYKAVKTLAEMLVECGSTWTTAKRLTSVLNAILILSDSQYDGWQPGKEDLIDIQMGMFCFVDRHGKRSLRDAWRSEEDEETESNSYGSTSFENTPSSPSIPSVERSISGSSSSHLSPVSPSSVEEAIPTRIDQSPIMVGEITQTTPSEPGAIPGPENTTGSFEPSAPMDVGSSFIPGGPPDGRFFNNPVSIRTLMTGSGDGYRSPEPPSRLQSLYPLHHLRRESTRADGGPTNSGSCLPETATDWPGPSLTATLPTRSLGFDPERGYGQLPPLQNSSVLPAELMVYNDLMVDISTAQYLGTWMQDLGAPPFAHPTMSANSGGGDFDLSSNWYQLESVSQPVIHEPPSMMRSVGCPSPGSQCRGVNQSFAGQAGTGFGGQRSPGGIRDYNAWERALYESFMMGQQTSQGF